MTLAVAFPLEKVTVRSWLGKKFLPLAITSIELIVPAALTFAENSGKIDSGPKGSSTVTTGGAPWLYPLPPSKTSRLLINWRGWVIIPVAGLSP